MDAKGSGRLAYTVDELVDLTTICRSKIYQEIRAGRLVATHCGRRTIFLCAAVEAWLSSMPSTGQISD